jgi:hypothetical protein
MSVSEDILGCSSGSAQNELRDRLVLRAASLNEKRTLLRTDSDSQPLALGASRARFAPRGMGSHLYHPFVVTVCVQSNEGKLGVSSSATTRHRWQRQRTTGDHLVAFEPQPQFLC